MCIIYYFWVLNLHSNLMAKGNSKEVVFRLDNITLHYMHYMCHGCGSFPRNSGGVRNSEFAHGVCKTLSSCQQNTILFRWAGLTTPTRLRFLFQLTFYITSRRNGVYDFITKGKGCQYSSNRPARCRLHRVSDATTK